MFKSEKINLLVLGASGMLGNAVVRWFAKDPSYAVAGSVRSLKSIKGIQHDLPQVHFISGVDVEKTDSLAQLFAEVRPDVVINCVGIVKQLTESNDPLAAIPINSLLPHRLAHLARIGGARLVHVSTDCVFSGRKGGYREEDFPDANDLYGRSKFLGEVDYENAVTLRTSIIGHEIHGQNSLVGWFLAQNGQVRGFSKAIFSGLPTVELAQIIQNYVLPYPQLRGTYHVSAEPIDKFSLLRLLSDIYARDTEIVPDEHVVIDRSLDSSRFRSVTGYSPPDWGVLVKRMREFG